jgi:hypothetical protein
LSEIPRKKTTLEEPLSEYSSETDLSKVDNDENSFGGTTVAEIHDDFDLEEHGTFVLTLLKSKPNTS